MYEEQLSAARARELRIVRNEAGVRVPAKKSDGRLYERWAAASRLRVQRPGETLSQAITRRAAAQAVVPLRNSAFRPPAPAPPGRGPAPAESGSGSGRAGASLLAGARRAAAPVVPLGAGGGGREAGGAGGAGGEAESKRARLRRVRAEGHRRRLELKRKGDARPLTDRLRRAMEARAEALRKQAKGLRVGGRVTAEAALRVHKRSTAAAAGPSRRRRPAGGSAQ